MCGSVRRQCRNYRPRTVFPRTCGRRVNESAAIRRRVTRLTVTWNVFIVLTGTYLMRTVITSVNVVYRSCCCCCCFEAIPSEGRAVLVAPSRPSLAANAKILAPSPLLYITVYKAKLKIYLVYWQHRYSRPSVADTLTPSESRRR
jgi:hypothetical protein